MAARAGRPLKDAQARHSGGGGHERAYGASKREGEERTEHGGTRGGDAVMDGRAGDATSPAPHLAARIDLQRCLWTPGHQINYIWWEFYLFPILHVRWGARYIRFPLQGTPRDHHPHRPRRHQHDNPQRLRHRYLSARWMDSGQGCHRQRHKGDSREQRLSNGSSCATAPGLSQPTRSDGGPRLPPGTEVTGQEFLPAQ